MEIENPNGSFEWKRINSYLIENRSISKLIKSGSIQNFIEDWLVYAMNGNE